MPPVLGPRSPSSARLWSWEEARYRARRPSHRARIEASSPCRHSSISTVSAAAPSRRRPISPASASRASAREPQTVTPLPPARPPALTTRGPSGIARTCPWACPRESNTAKSGWGMPCRRMKRRAWPLSPSSRAAWRLGPNSGRPRSRNTPSMPAHRGASGPTTVRSMPRLSAKSASFSRPAASEASMGTLFGVPAFPGAVYTACTRGLRSRAAARACSRPPPPTTRTLAICLLLPLYIRNRSAGGSPSSRRPPAASSASRPASISSASRCTVTGNSTQSPRSLSVSCSCRARV